MSGSDPWAEFRQQPRLAADPWAEFRQRPAVPATNPENDGIGGYYRGAQRAIQNSTMLGLRDEAQAAADATVGYVLDRVRGRDGGSWSDRYTQSVERERATDRDYAQRNPVTSVVGNVVGSLMVPMPSIAPAASGAGRLVEALRSAPVRLAAPAAAGGAAAGFGEGEGGLEGRASSAAMGAGIGAVGGAALAGGANLAGQIGGRVAHALGLRNPEVAADRQIIRALDRDGVPLASVAQPQYGPAVPSEAPRGLVDMGGRNLTNLGAVAANTPSRSMEVADAFVQARRDARPERIASAVDDAFGGGGGTRVPDEVAALRTRRQEAADPLYDRAWRVNVPQRVHDFLNPIIALPEGQEALRRGLRIIEREHAAGYLRHGDELFDQATMGVTRADDGGLMIQRGQNLRLLDAVKRGFDDMLETYRNPTTHRLELDEAGRALNDMREAYVQQLRNRFGVYDRALDAWSGPTQTMTALGDGQRALGLNRDIVAGIVQRLSPGDLEFFRLGVGRAITDAARTPDKASAIAKQMVDDRVMRARLESAIPDPAQRAQFIAAMQNEVRMADVDRAVSPRAGSQTPRLTAAGDDMGRDAPGGVFLGMLSAAAQGTGSLVRSAASGLSRVTQGINSATSDALADRLFNVDQAANRRIVQALLERQRTDAANSDVWRRRLTQAFGSGGLTIGLNQDQSR